MLQEIIRILAAPIIDPLEDLVATVEQLQQQVQDTKNSLQQAIARIEEDVQALRDKVATGIDPQDLDPISQGLSDLKSNLDALDPDPDNPAEAPSA
jgi:septal ring factor EnvC (AmiA/AmiB activator)